MSKIYLLFLFVYLPSFFITTVRLMRFLFLFLFLIMIFFTVDCGMGFKALGLLCAKNGYFYNFIISPAPQLAIFDNEIPVS